MCASACKFDAITLENKNGIIKPAINNQCTQCGACMTGCGRYELDSAAVQKKIFSDNLHNEHIGYYKNCYTGFACDKVIRKQASSGGIATTVLKHLFETGKIDSAIVTRSSDVSPFNIEPFVAKSISDLELSCRSTYSQSAVNSLFKQDIGERIALVGLPCHIQSMRKMEQSGSLLKGKSIFTIGLFCSHNLTQSAKEFICFEHKINCEKVTSFSFRGDGWPSGIRIKTADNETCIPNQGNYWANFFMSFLFTPAYCFPCTDQTAELADISVGDAWLPEYLEHDTQGTSIIVVRSDPGQQLMSEIVEVKKVSLNHISVGDVIESQKWPLFYKKACLEIKSNIAPQMFLFGNKTIRKHHFKKPLFLHLVRFSSHFHSGLLKVIPRRMLDKYRNYIKSKIWSSSQQWRP